ncbi:PERQ amino acid-rich with GYF domain-containing protein CG11148 isoform X3 [Pseudomyrmex gracilis]|uniref:PERQ amino acid-rich with GYF domain-containing protein CG11148 isoform X3 n=1 Tax=Pseudomyrmex gracilis TaxID=219809 RepID=UPI000995026F|nr:PERQ amino acid-rich with GYF domain-containing protein CG11148 isoform X3 [Pseudomyrmex gracilis]
MTDSMKFGPEWLRNLSGDSCNTASGSGGGTTTLSTPRYQLAEHRYGREEMLALFDRNNKPPELLTTFAALYVEKTQLPLALIQMTEDETRMWNGGISNIGGRGRGSSVDRGGRGRPGRGGLYSSHYSRGVGFDDSGDGIRTEGQSFQVRNRPFDRSQSERGWSERNGATDPGEWNGSTSPRKELSRGTGSGSSLMESNWRRHRGEDDDGWRKWGRSSWRESGSMDRDRIDRNEGENEEGRGGPGRWEHRASHRSSHDSGHHPPPPRTARTWESNHHDNHDNLPEWATENPTESGGSFDSSGAFHGLYSDDDEDGVAGASQSGRTRRVSEGSASNVVKSNSKPLAFGTGSVPSSSNRQTSNTIAGTLGKERLKPLDPLENKDDSGKEGRCDSPSVKPATVSLTETIPTKSLMTSTDLTQKKTIGSATADTIEIKEKPDEPPSGSHKEKETFNVQTLKVKTEVTTEPGTQINATTNRQIPPDLSTSVHNSVAASSRQKTDDDLDGRMEEEIDKLMADEESHKEKTSVNSVPPPIGNQPSGVSATGSQEKWYYRDPQGEVQGPFLASEMAEWCKAGYFSTALLVRRSCDERYATLGDLIKMCGRVPFSPGPPIPPLKLTEQVIPPVPNTVPAGLTTGALPKTGMEDPLLLLQYQQMVLHNQLLVRQARTSAIAKLSQSEHWATLSPVEQNQLIQYVIQDGMPEIPEVPIATNPFVPHIVSQPTNPVIQLFTQMQAKTQPETRLPTNPHTTASAHPATVDPIQQLIQQMGGIQNLPTVQQPNIAPAPTSTQEDNPIKSLLRQLNVNTNSHSQTAPHLDTAVWPPPPPQIAPQFNAQNWLAQIGPIPAMPSGQLPGSLWDLHAKDIKTEQQILEEQKLKLQEDRKKEELRKQEELQRQVEEENALRKQKEEQARQVEEAKRKDEERKRKEEEKKRKEEEKRKQEEELKKKEEKKRKEEEKKREEKRKQEEENLKKRLEEEKRKREELKKFEEKQKKEEERRRKLEEEQRKQEEERIRKEAEARRQAEAEEQARRAEQRRREAEALRKLQERNKAPWAQAPRTLAPATHTASLAEIQKLEREKKVEELRIQQLMQQQLAQQKAIETAQELSVADSSKRLQFKWAEKALASNKVLQVKSLAQIQQEEQERIVKVKERERQEKAGQKESASVLQNAGIWGTASQCLSWANSGTSSSSQAWSSAAGTTGFWDDPTPVRLSAAAKQSTKQSTATIKSVPSQQQQSQQNINNNNNKASKSKNKREEELVKKLFEQNTAKTDEFTQWCNKALSGIQASVDIPTFVGFLRDIESAYEVKEYVRVYLGDTKQSQEFAKQFLEKRSKWRSAQRPQAQADDLCKPAPAVNPNAPAEFQEVKGKSKKPKKGKMFKVDNRILGFSVTAAPDRINVGDRDYGEGV